MIRMTQEDVGSKPTYVYSQDWTEGVGGHFAPQDSLVLSNLAIRMLFPVLVIWTFSCVTFSPFHVLPLLHILWCTWPCTLSGCLDWSVWTCWQMTCIGNTRLQLHSAPPSHGWWLSQCSPSFRNYVQNDFSPTLGDTLEHLKASPECSPWRPTMALAVPFSYSW